MVLRAIALALAALLLATAGFLTFLHSGAYDVGADAPHTPAVRAALERLRERSIARHARGIEPPDLTDAALIRQGAGNYDAMCASCHRAPGVAETELSRGLYPAPPAFAENGIDDPARAFWAIKHGIKSTGMPAWGKSMSDEYIWGLVAFMKRLPTLDAAEYGALVASSAGHSHGRGESAGSDAAPEHDHDGSEDHHHEH